MPGRGRSDWLQNKLNYNYNTYQIVATTLLARLQAPVIDWVGISMGGILGMKLSALPSCPIRKLVLIDIGAFVPKDSLVRIGTYLGKEPLFRSVDEYKQVFRVSFKQFGNLSEAHWDQMIRHSARVTQDETNQPVVKPHYDQQINLPFLDPTKLGDMDMWAEWDRIKASVLLLRGSQSDVLPAEVAAQMSTRGPGLARFLEFPDCGHCPHLFFEDKIAPVVEHLSL
eukprot:TRINITY_DN1598_c0_g1_i2.p1 TRINITY_DN1598_c0_g1~~TRINITY_DN1598_c0_g1_i2.p1  ORF type:complete len:226 (+),score=43.04 TRINITY_DN1598_c0_g1_i2:166-843(+)